MDKKKRDCPHADDDGEADGGTPPEKCKKFRPEESEKHETITENESNKRKEGTKLRKMDPTGCNDPAVQPVDIETALHRLFQQDGAKEILSDDTTVMFRAGHAGDAPAIESCYREATKATHLSANEKTETESSDDDKKRERKNSEQEPSSSLELWLSEAMGDEDTPPSVYSILADVSSSSISDVKPTKRLGAVALFSLAWKDNQRMLRMEWCHVDKSLPEAQVLERRMWLRLSALSLMTGACLSVSDDVQIDIVESTKDE